jgi:hypothetical protein
MPLRLADTSVRLYRKRDGSVSVRLRSYLMIHSKGGGFRLSTYLNKLECSLTLATGEVVSLEDYSYTYDCLGRGRDEDFSPPPAQIRTCGTTAYGSCLES